jgi:predicted acyl esterase
LLSAPVKVSGQPVANLIASTSGTDSDWVVKVIDEIIGPQRIHGRDVAALVGVSRRSGWHSRANGRSTAEGVRRTE